MSFVMTATAAPRCGGQGLDRLRDRAAARSLDLVVITAPDRLARNYVHQVLLLEELQGHGCEVRFLDRPMSQDPHDQLLLQIRGAVAEYERTLITERMRRGRQRKLEAGLMLPWTRAPFGYRVDPDRPRDPAGVRIEEAEAAIVREMFAWYAEEAHSFCSLARLLEQRGIRTSTGLARWNLASIRGLLTNPAYAGQVYGNRWHRRGTLERRSATAPRKHSAMSRVDAPREEWILVAEIPPLVSQEQFDRVQARLASNRRFAQRNNKAHPYLLRGLVSCGRMRLGLPGADHHPRVPLLLLHRQAAGLVLASGAEVPVAAEPGRAPGRAGLGRSLRSAEPSRAGLARPGTGAWWAVAAAGTPGTPAGTTTGTGEPRAATRAADGGLSRRGGPAGRIPPAPA